MSFLTISFFKVEFVLQEARTFSMRWQSALLKVETGQPLYQKRTPGDMVKTFLTISIQTIRAANVNPIRSLRLD